LRVIFFSFLLLYQRKRARVCKELPVRETNQREGVTCRERREEEEERG
jgi:hypothetical protein